MAAEVPPLLIRQARKKDIDFITNSWLRSYRDAAFPCGVPNKVYYHHHHKVLEHVIPRSTLLVSCSSEDTDHIIGWACAEVTKERALVIHYVYVKYPYRRLGVANSLVNMLVEYEEPVAVMTTHRTKATGTTIKRRKYVYNPYLLFVDMEKDWNQ